MKVLSVAALLLVVSTGARAFPDGPPPEACLEMIPHHDVEAQNQPIPAQVDQSFLCDGGKKSVQVNITGNENFMGLFVQIRKRGGTEIVAGIYSDFDQEKLQLQDCLGGSNNALSHKNASPIESASFTWTTSEVNQEVDLVYTFVKDKDTFWVQAKDTISSC